jgi:energy-coupling factor transport system permease protein
MASPLRLSDKLTPVTWWLLCFSLAIAAGLSQSVVFLASICAFAFLGMVFLPARGVALAAIRLYAVMATGIIIVRIGFRILFNSPTADPSALSLPQLSIHLFGVDYFFLGPVSHVNLLAGVTDGFRLAAIILSIGLASAVANPRKLIRSAPAVLYEFATATAIAINVAPQLVTSLNRVRRARTLRGGSARLSGLKSVVIPVLEDTIQRSLDLAASMDSRGFGRRGAMRLRVVYASRTAGAMGIMLLGTASYLVLATSYSTGVGIVTAVLGAACIGVAARLAGMHRVRTRLTLNRPSPVDWLVRLSCLVIVVASAITAVEPGFGVLGWHV